jgi:LmbE family N-acetylglucosaminyl deacetylase
MPADHKATYRIVLAAAGCLDAVTVFEYPVWFWFHWPWVPYPLNNRRDLPVVVRDNLRSIRRLLKHFTTAVDIGGCVDDKKHALDAYESQMTRLGGDPEWPRLQDVADGEFLNLFFQDHELFRESLVAGDGRQRYL